MNSIQIIRSVFCVLTAAFGGLALWYRQSAAIRSRTASLIAEAENRYSILSKSGDIKFEWVASRIYQTVPAALRLFFPRSLINSVIQATFDAMESYSAWQLECFAEKVKRDVNTDAM